MGHRIRTNCLSRIHFLNVDVLDFLTCICVSVKLVQNDAFRVPRKTHGCVRMHMGVEEVASVGMDYYTQLLDEYPTTTQISILLDKYPTY